MMERFRCLNYLMMLQLIFQREDDGKVQMSDLPDDVVREILFCLSDHNDLVNAGLARLRPFDLTEENTFWRRLCLFHFTNRQWMSVIKRGEEMETLGWKNLYTRLMKWVQTLNNWSSQFNCVCPAYKIITMADMSLILLYHMIRFIICMLFQS